MRFGCCVLRFGPGFGEEQVNTMSALGATVLHAVPSFAATLGLQAAPRRGELKVRKVVTIGENVMTRDLLRNALGRKIEELWGVELFSTYGCTEGPFIAAECGARAGHHYHPYEVLVEVLDGETHRPVEPGELGVVAVTPLGVEGFPLLRYLTGDVSFLVPGECPCGVLTPRLGPIVARTDQRMKIKGAVVYPEAVKEIIRGFPEIDGFQIEVYTRGFVDELRVHFHAPCELASALSAALYGGLGISVEALPCTREEMAARLFPPDAGKPRVFLDDRRKPQRDGLPQQDGAPGR